MGSGFFVLNPAEAYCSVCCVALGVCVAAFNHVSVFIYFCDREAELISFQGPACQLFLYGRCIASVGCVVFICEYKLIQSLVGCRYQLAFPVIPYSYRDDVTLLAVAYSSEASFILFHFIVMGSGFFVLDSAEAYRSVCCVALGVCVAAFNCFSFFIHFRDREAEFISFQGTACQLFLYGRCIASVGCVVFICEYKLIQSLVGCRYQLAFPVIPYSYRDDVTLLAVAYSSEASFILFHFIVMGSGFFVLDSAEAYRSVCCVALGVCVAAFNCFSFFIHFRDREAEFISFQGTACQYFLYFRLITCNVFFFIIIKYNL